MLVNEQPAYLKWSNTTDRDTLAHWLSSQTYSDGYYTNKPKFMVSQLKEWYGENATVENDYGYDWWPKVPSHDGSDWSEMSSFEKMKEGTMKGYYAWGMNPCHSAPNSGNVRRSMANCDWVVVVDQVITETASFWDAPDMNAEEIGTTCYFRLALLFMKSPGPSSTPVAGFSGVSRQLSLGTRQSPTTRSVISCGRKSAACTRKRAALTPILF